MSGKATATETVCVTGGAGFIGSHLATALVEAGHSVRVLDDFSTGRQEHLEPIRDRITIVDGSILDSNALDEALAGSTLVHHHAARVSVPESLEDPVRYRETNIDGTLAVLEAARRHRVRRMVYAGSCSAYGDLDGLPKLESDPVHPTSPYAATKLAGEDLTASYAVSYAIDTVRLRYFNVYGPRQAHDSAYAAVVPRFMDALSGDGHAVVFGDGLQTRDFVHVGDVVQANLLAGFHPEPLGGDVFNVGSGDRRSIISVLEDVASVLGCPVRVRHEPARDGEVRHSEASIERINTRLGFVPRRSFRESLAQMVSHV